MPENRISYTTPHHLSSKKLSMVFTDPGLEINMDVAFIDLGLEINMDVAYFNHRLEINSHMVTYTKIRR